MAEAYDGPYIDSSSVTTIIRLMSKIRLLAEGYWQSSYPDRMRKRMTKDSCDIPRISMKTIYGWYESSDRVTRGELSDIPVSCLWMCLPQASRPDDVGTHEWSEREVRFEIPQIAPGIPLATSLAVSLYPEARRWTETREYQCREALW